MKPKNKVILLSIISILLILLIVFLATLAFMRNNVAEGSVTTVALKSCAKIKLNSTGTSINMDNSYPMSRNRALKEVVPYTFTVSSSCDSYVGFTLYIGLLQSENRLSASDIHYILTEHDSKENILAEGTLTNDKNVYNDSSKITNQEKTQFNSKGNVDSIYELFNYRIALQGDDTYDLYLYIDESATLGNANINYTFKGVVGIKSYERDPYSFDIEYTNANVTSCTNVECSLNELYEIFDALESEEEE